MGLQEFREKFGTAFAEFLGTLTLVLVIQLAVGSGSDAAPLAIGFSLVAIVYAFGPISGAHVNPAVTLSVFLRGKCPAHQVVMYWIAQVLGGLAGALLGAIIGGVRIAPSMGKGSNFMQAFIAELVFVAVLCFIVLSVALSKAAENNSWYGLAIGLWILGGAYAVGGVSGGSFNPAVTIGLSSVKGIHKFAYALWMIAAQMGGAFLGTFAYYVAAPAEFTEFSADLRDIGHEGRSLLPTSGEN